MRLAACHDNACAETSCRPGEFSDEPAFPYAGGPDDADEVSAAGAERVHQLAQVSVAAQHRSFVAGHHELRRRNGIESLRRHRFFGALDGDGFDRPKLHGSLDEAGGRLRTQHTAWWRRSLHPLRHPDMMTNGGVSGADLARNDLAGVKSDAELQIDIVASKYFRGQLFGHCLDLQRSEASPHGVVFKRSRRAEHRHDAVARELARRTAVARHHGRGPVEQFGHDLAQPLRPHGRRDVHRMNDIGEQHRHLLVLRRCRSSRNGRPALVTELRVGRQLSTARPAHHGCRRHVTPPPHGRSRRYRVTAGRPTCAISPPRFVQRVARYAVPRGAGVSGGFRRCAR